MQRKLVVLVSAVLGTAIICGVAAAGSSPTVATGATSAVAQNTALLHGTVNPNGTSTTYYFQWGLTAGYGTNGAPLAAGGGVKTKAVHEAAGALSAGTTYHYRLVATNQFGTTVGADRTFTTTGHPPPGAATGAAVGLATTSATLTGAVYPQGAATSWWFQWGTTGYTQQTAAQQTAALSSPQLVEFPLQDLLAPGTIYHYRLVASHSGSPPSYGADNAFMTYPYPRPVPRVLAGTQPGRAPHPPYVFTTSGSVVGPAFYPHNFVCYGDVTIRFFRGTRQVGLTLAGIQPNCTYSAQTVFARKPGKPTRRPVFLRVVIRAKANSYLATNRAPMERIRLG
jgi:hypothetical protein